ncbi:MAG TPA: Uma2 family endonuclease [Ktedonobacterales bacterium]|nr:Uma2 family endonuclease [Ktedonobacterales bacterium]
MAHETLAPWAQLVPDVGPMTVDELMELPDDDGWMYELVDGRLVRMPMSGGEASRIAIRIAATLFNFVEPRDLGAVLGPDGGFDLTQPGETEETALGPDASFVQKVRIPARDSPEYKRAWHLAPDLVVEVASPNQYRPEMASKSRRYLGAGSRLIWVVWPKSQQVDVWRAGADDPVQTLTLADSLDGLDVLPGFTYPLARLFA